MSVTIECLDDLPPWSLVSVARAVRAWAEIQAAALHRPSLNGFCAIAAVELWRRLSPRYRVSVIHGDGHAFVRVRFRGGCWFIDVTATQFAGHDIPGTWLFRTTGEAKRRLSHSWDRGAFSIMRECRTLAGITRLFADWPDGETHPLIRQRRAG